MLCCSVPCLHVCPYQPIVVASVPRVSDEVQQATTIFCSLVTTYIICLLPACKWGVYITVCSVDGNVSGTPVRMTSCSVWQCRVSCTGLQQLALKLPRSIDRTARQLITCLLAFSPCYIIYNIYCTIHSADILWLSVLYDEYCLSVQTCMFCSAYPGAPEPH